MLFLHQNVSFSHTIYSGLVQSHHSFRSCSVTPFIQLVQSHHSFSSFSLTIHSARSVSPFIQLVQSHHSFSSFSHTIHSARSVTLWLNETFIASLYICINFSMILSAILCASNNYYCLPLHCHARSIGAFI